MSYKLSIALALILPILFLVSCGSDEGDTVNEISTVYADTKGDLFVSAFDAVSGELISNAEFYLPAADTVKRKSSGTSGTVYRNLPIGENYSVSVSANKYASAVCNASIKLSSSAANQNITVAENATLKVPMRKLAASLRGSVFYQDLANLQTLALPAEGASLAVMIKDGDSCSFEKKIYGPVKANKDGAFSFDSLPEGVDYELVVYDAFLGGRLYSGMRATGTLGISGSAVITPRMVYSAVQTALGFVIDSDSRLVAEKGDSLKFGFSETVNVSMIKSGDLSVAKIGGITVAADFIWDGSNKNLSIIPAFGEWETGKSYEIRLKLYSLLSSKTIDTMLVYSVNEFLDLSKISVSEVVFDSINYNAASIRLHWNAIAGVESYEIYGKVSSKFETEFGFLGEVSTKTKGIVDTTVVLQTPSWFLNGDSALILVAAKNSKGRTAFGEPLSVKDNIKPYFTVAPTAQFPPDTANYRIDAMAYFTATAKSEIPQTVNFSEPMDTSAVLSANVPNELPREFAVGWKWNGETSIIFTFTVGAGEAYSGETALKIPISISGFRDKAKNPIRGSKVGEKIWEDLFIILHVDSVPAPSL